MVLDAAMIGTSQVVLKAMPFFTDTWTPSPDTIFWKSS
jgi:hypothetical protein